MRRRILVIAPTLHNHNPLPSVADEIAEIRRYHDALVLDGDVDLIDITRAVNDGNFDVLWFATGAAGNQVHLSRETIGAGELMRLLAASKARLLVLATCDTQTLPNRLRAANVHILAGIDVVRDDFAASVSMQFARALYELRSIRKAYYSLSAGEEWLYLSPNGALEDARWYWLAGGIGIAVAFFVGMMALGAL